jgi:cullin 1
MKRSEDLNDFSLGEEWEEIFRTSTTKYYEDVAKQLSNRSADEYIASVCTDIFLFLHLPLSPHPSHICSFTDTKKVQHLVEHEKSRVALFLPDFVRISNLRICEQVLVQSRMELFLENFNLALVQQDISRLSRIFDLLARIPSALDPCYEHFGKSVLEAGLQAIEEAVASVKPQDNSISTDATKPSRLLLPQVFVAHLVSIIRKYQAVVAAAFNNDREFVRSMDKACRKFVNWNAACEYDTDAPEMLAKYTHSLLTRTTTNTLTTPEGPSNREATVSPCRLLRKYHIPSLLFQIIIFKYLEDRETFVKLHAQMLARRLSQASSISEDIEKSMINSLQVYYNHTDKLKHMLLDLETIKDLDPKFNKWCLDQSSDDVPPFSTSFKVLSAAKWPLRYNDIPFIAPTELHEANELFGKFYRDEHPGRKLFWHWNLCHGELRLKPKSGPSPAYLFQVSAYQMAILILFNEADQVTIDEIKQHTGLHIEIIEPLMAVFEKVKLVKRVSEHGDIRYGINDEYTSKRIKNNIRVALKRQQDAELGELHRKIKEERKLLMQVSQCSTLRHEALLILS